MVFGVENVVKRIMGVQSNTEPRGEPRPEIPGDATGQQRDILRIELAGPTGEKIRSVEERRGGQWTNFMSEEQYRKTPPADRGGAELAPQTLGQAIQRFGEMSDGAVLVRRPLNPQGGKK